MVAAVGVIAKDDPRGIIQHSGIEQLVQQAVNSVYRYPDLLQKQDTAMGVNLAGYKKYLYQVYALYNGGGKKCVLPMKF